MADEYMTDDADIIIVAYGASSEYPELLLILQEKKESEQAL